MTASTSRGGRAHAPGYARLALQVLADCVAVSLIVLLSVVLLPGERSWPPAEGVGKLFLEVWLYTISIAAPAHWIMPRLYPFVADKRPAVQWSVFVVLLATISAGGSLIGSVGVFALNLEPGVPFREIVSLSIKLSIYLALLVGVIHCLVVMLRDRLDDAEAALHARELDYERARKLAAEARLAALEARVHPHFFFNALNTVSSLIPSAPERAERLIERMSALLRFSLEAHEEGLVPLDREMKIVRDYLDIEQARFAERLRYTIDVSDDALGCRIPPLSVQTLVENSVKYAVSPARNGAEIRVRARVEGASVRIEGASERVERQSERVERQSERVEGQSERVERQSVRIEVADTGAGFSTADITTGHGLDVLRRRLTAMLGAPEPLAVSREGGWTTVSFRVPA